MTTAARYHVIAFSPHTGTRTVYVNLPRDFAQAQAGDLAQRFPGERFYLVEV